MLGRSGTSNKFYNLVTDVGIIMCKNVLLISSFGEWYATAGHVRCLKLHHYSLHPALTYFCMKHSRWPRSIPSTADLAFFFLYFSIFIFSPKNYIMLWDIRFTPAHATQRSIFFLRNIINKIKYIVEII